MKKPLGEKFFGNRLIKAAEQGNTDACQRQLTRRGVGMSSKVNSCHRSSGNSPLHQACANGHVCTARLLLEKGAKINANNVKGETPLMMACRNRQVEIVKFLLEDYYKENNEIGKAGCNVNEKNNAGWTALHYACSFVHRNKKNTTCIDMAYLLLNHGALINGAANSGWTALHFASHKGHVRLVKALMDRGANIAAKTNKASGNKTPVEMANHGCKPQVLLDYQATLEERKLRDQEEGGPLQRSLLTSSVAMEKEQQKNQAEQEIALAKLEENFATTKQLLETMERHQRTEAMHTLMLRQQLKSLEDRVQEQEQEKVEMMEETINLLEETVDLKAHVTALEREQKKQKLKQQLAELDRGDATEATYDDVTESHRGGEDEDEDDKQQEEEKVVTTAKPVRHRSYRSSSSSSRSTKRSFRSSSSSASKTPLTRSMV